MCSKMALGSAAEPPWPSKVQLETASKPPVHSKVLSRPAPRRATQNHGPSLHHSEKQCSIQLRGRFAIESATRHLCFLLSRWSCVFVSVVDVAFALFVVAFFSCFCSDVFLWCSCLFRCFLLLVFFGEVGWSSFSKVLFESAARNRRSKLLFEVTGLCSAGLRYSSLCSPFLRAWICTGSH